MELGMVVIIYDSSATSDPELTVGIGEPERRFHSVVVADLMVLSHTFIGGTANNVGGLIIKQEPSIDHGADMRPSLVVDRGKLEQHERRRVGLDTTDKQRHPWSHELVMHLRFQKQRLSGVLTVFLVFGSFFLVVVVKVVRRDEDTKKCFSCGTIKNTDGARCRPGGDRYEEASEFVLG